MIALADVAAGHSFVSGLVLGNLTKIKDSLHPTDEVRAQTCKGGMSGAPCARRSMTLTSLCYSRYGRRFVLVGCGGILTAQDAYDRIRAGASLLQIVTALIFNGPQVVSEMHRGLIELLRADGFRCISEAVGTKLVNTDDV
mmetsp:Transcript_33547/g.72388  ORF Transcript_33547/g.72388 Transcript_33547/m.72388 type:complete len:141 (+) Transcript_33547:3-425(+)